MKTREKVIGTLLLGNNIVNILASALATSILIAVYWGQRDNLCNC